MLKTNPFKSTRWYFVRQRASSVLQRLVEPAHLIQEPEAWLNARLLAALLLALLCLDLLGALVLTMTNSPMDMGLMLWGTLIPLLVAYALSRTRHYRVGAALSIFTLSLLPYVIIALVPPELRPELLLLSLAWLSLPVLLTSIFFSIRSTILHIALINLSLLLLLAVIPDINLSAVGMLLGLVLIVSILIVALLNHREQIGRSRQARLAEGEARYRRLAENAQDIIYRYSRLPQQHITYVNPVVEDILGYTPDEFYQDPDLFFRLISPDDQAALFVIAPLNERSSRPVTLRWMRKDGTQAWIEHRNVPIFDEAGNWIAVEGVARDVTERKELEETLRRSEANLAEAQRIAHFGSWTWDLATGKLYCSDEMFRIVGLLPQALEVTQEVFLQFLHPDEVAWILENIQQVDMNDPLLGLEHRLVRPNGEVRNVYSRVKVYRDEQERPLRLLGSTQDITERKQAEIQSERNVRQLSALAHMGQTVVASLDLTVVLSRVIEEISSLVGADGVSVLLIEEGVDLVFAASHQADSKLLGRRMPLNAGVAGEVVRTGQAVHIHDGAGQARIYREIDHAIGFHTQSLLAVPLSLRDEIIGVMEAVHTQPAAFSHDDLRLLEAGATWATVAINNARLFEAERRRVREQVALLEITQMALSSFEFNLPALKHIARRIAQACHATQCLLLLLEEQASIVRPIALQYADGHEDQDLQRVLDELTVERLEGLPALHTIIRERRPHLFKNAQQAGLLPEEWWRFCELKQVLAVPLLSQTTAIGLMLLGYQADEVVGNNYFDLALTIGAQIAIAFANTQLYADLQRALQHERDARAQAVQAEKLAAIGRLSASLAHELNNPLQAIQNLLYLVRQENVLNQQSQEDLDVALTESRRMADLIDRMRETYRPATVTEFRPESLNVLISEVEKLISTHLRHNAVTFEFKPDPHLPEVSCLRDQLKQVILNLSLNAVDAMPHGGRLAVSTTTSPEDHGIWMMFRDTGQGITQEDLPNIFDPFFTRKAGGTGLGLAISYDIVQQHHGLIDVESELGRGTLFRIWLPTKGL